MPATLSTVPRPTCDTIASTAAAKATWSASSGLMSLNTTPGSGKSGTSVIRLRSSASRSSATSAPALGRRPAALALDLRLAGGPACGSRRRGTGRCGRGGDGAVAGGCRAAASSGAGAEAIATDPPVRAAARSPARPVPLRRASTRAVSALYCGSRSLRSASSGVARNSEEYAPEARPTNSASARSLRVPAPSRKAPTNSRPETGSSAMSEVLIERMKVWLTASSAASL